MGEITVALLRFLLAMGIGVYLFLPVVKSEDTGAEPILDSDL